jgi:serine/threonine protein phosphatase PrpC
MANDRGGRDNISVVVVRVDRKREPKRAPEPEPQGFLGWLRTKLGA